jgi:hypothetical protein
MKNSLNFDAANHHYSINGKAVLSVTKILAHSGIVKSEFYRGTEALDRGTAVHDLTARRDIGEKIPLTHIPLKLRGYVKAWDRFRSETGFTPTLVEHRVVCPKPQYAGTLDRLGKFGSSDPVETLIDLKTHAAGRVQDWVKYQLVGYGHALNPKRIYHRVGVALHPNGTYAITRFTPSDWMVDLAVFLNAAKQAIQGNEFMRFTRRNGRR